MSYGEGDMVSYQQVHDHCIEQNRLADEAEQLRLKRMFWGRELTFLRYKADNGLATEDERKIVELQRCSEWDDVLPLYEEP